jgi:predicted AAA+ superfamily ATPase
MQRKAMQQLIRWKNSLHRQPLLLEGARQTGKTWLMKEFGRTCYQNTVYLNFDENKKAGMIFQDNIDPGHIIPELELMAGFKIIPQETLIIFDEVQECNRALVSLKYFCEDAPEYHLIAAGSLLGVAIHKGDSFPVGKVNILHIYPLNLAEFLDALGEARYQMALEHGDYSAFRILESDLIRRLRDYYFTGGMPLAVRAFAERRDFDEVRSIQRDILVSFERDFSKHINVPSIPKVGLLWDSIPQQLAREKKQFVYKHIKEGSRAAQYEDALYWLERVGLVYRVNRVTVPSLPLSGFGDTAFKLYMLDVGLLSAKTGLTLHNLTESRPGIFNHFHGALTEQYVMQELKAMDAGPNTGPEIFYWANERKKGLAEVDFLLQYQGSIIPLEAKAAVNLKAKSLKAYMDYYKPETAIRTSLSGYGRNKNLVDIPLYLIGQFPKIAGLAP